MADTVRPIRAGPREVRWVDLQAQRHRLGGRIEAAIADVLDHGQFILGPEVGTLEDRLARFSGARHAVSCASGTDALLLALLAWGVGPGDAVAVPSFTFVASAEVVPLVGATPVFVEVQPDTFNIDPGSVADAVEVARHQGLRLVGVIAVDLFGQPADYAAVGQVAADHGLWVLGDAAQSFGASLHGVPVGTLAPVTATSFFPAKPLGAYGDGGAVLTDDADLAERLRSLREHGRGSTKYEHVQVGVNGRLDTLQAAVLLEKLSIFDDELLARQAVAERYGAGLADVVGVPAVMDGATSAWAQYTVVLDDRDRVAAALGRRGIPTAVYYPRPLHRQAAFCSFPRTAAELAVSDRLSREVLSLPIHPYLEPAAQDRVIQAVRDGVS